MKDVHDKTAEALFGSPPKDAEEAADRRAAAQAVNFGHLYGSRKPVIGGCGRCGKLTSITKMSWFNTDALCDSCGAEEEAHPDYGYAKSVETEAVKAGNLNFPGVGWPEGR